MPNTVNHHFSKYDFEKAFVKNEMTHYFQGIVNLFTHKIDYFEALARWNHPKLGLINAAIFINELSGYGFLPQLTELAIHSIRQYLEWSFNHNKISVPVSINITASEFEFPNYANYFTNLLLKSQLPIKLITIEMLEWGDSNNLKVIAEVVEQLKLMGIKVYADDFGHAYGSFHRMMNIAYTGIKLDAEYTRSLENRIEAQVIIQSMVNFSQRLSLDLVLEGIETVAQANFLKALGVKNGQGYLYNRPMPYTETHLWLDDKIEQHMTQKMIIKEFLN